jgi:Icc-related predicted phosphoesterase
MSSAEPARRGRPDFAPLRVLGLMDVHWSGRGKLRLPDLTDVDLVLLGGDLTHFAGIDVARALVEEIQEAGPRVLAVCGNCDLPEIESYLEETGIALDRRAKVIAGADARAAAEGSSATGPTILLSHQPPYGTKCDRVLKLRHVGSRAIRALIEDWQPDLVLCGHIHESIGSDLIGETRVINPGPWRSGHSLRFDITTDGLEFLAST